MADRSKPLTGRCNANTENGYCHARPKMGTTRCRLHGGYAQAWSARMQKIDAAAQEEIDCALDDPNLLDVRRPIAIMEALLQRTELFPSDEMCRRIARQRIIRSFPPENLAEIMRDRDLREEFLEPTEDDIEEVRRELHERSLRMLNTFARRQEGAVKMLEWTRAIREVALPVIGELGLRMTRVLKRYVPEEQLVKALEELRAEGRQTIGELALLRDETTK